jgi:hypothetical protein
MKILKNRKQNILSIIGKYSFIFMFAFILASPVFAEPCTGEDDKGVPTPYGCDLTDGSTRNPTDGSTKNPTDGSTRNPTDGSTKNPTDGSTNNGVKIDAHIENPLGDGIGDIPSFIAAILNFVLLLGIPIIVLAIIYTGFLFVTALGNSEKLKTAKRALLYVIIGAALLLGAFVVAEAIKGTVEEISSEAQK